MSPKTIAIIGGLDADLIMIAGRIPGPGESVLANHYQEALGGKGANSAIATYRTCHRKPLAAGTVRNEDDIQVKMIGAVGDDEYGLGGGIRPDLVVAQMEIDKTVVDTMMTTSGKAGIDFCLNAAPATPISECLYRYLTHLLFLNRGVTNVVITLGAKGAFYANAECSGHCPAYDTEVEHTTGAGDTFTGAYASEYMRQKTKGEWMIAFASFCSKSNASIYN
ncbi:ribokinase [Fusarium austroafricanum]|uniref:Ribokinase n=1 Tax=Fusarium austroafricanum TaxID=2364996 RepID=A0A8H4KF61_9HYPO|nr:ribokinase [Fusarium austroafricanum]